MAQLFSSLVLAMMVILIQPAAGGDRPISIGQTAPDFAVQSLNGTQTIRLSDFRGRRVLIFTWASW